jgi:hypothetical protein
LVVLSAIIMAIVFVLSGCGSDSSSPQTNNNKKIAVQKLPTPKDPKRVDRVSAGKINILLSDSLPGLTADQQRAKEEATKALSNPNFEVLPGWTLEKLKAKEERALRDLNAPNFEVRPGWTVAKMKPKEEKALRDLSAPNFEVRPGLTKVELKAYEADALRQMNDPNFEVLPGMTKQEMNAKKAEVPTK